MRIQPRAERLAKQYLEDLQDLLLIFEPPLRSKRYIASVDVGDGVGLDYSVIEITRVADVYDPDEQVAQFVTNSIDPIDLACYVDVIGRFYVGSDRQPAMAAIETNNHGLTTQAELQKRYGYTNLFIFQKEDVVDPERRFSNKAGWVTSRFTRPIIITRYLKRLKSFKVDPLTKKPVADYLIHSPFTFKELRTLKRLPGETLGEAVADPNDPNAHDDCVMAGAIGVHVAQTLHYEEGESVDQTRHRLAEERQRRALHKELTGVGFDFYNSDYTSEEMTWLQGRAGILGRTREEPW